jgi:hypothetical protein
LTIKRSEAIPGTAGRVFVPALPTRWDAVTESRQGVYNLNDAAKFGTIVVLSNDTDPEPSAIVAMEEALELFNPKTDYILAIGDVARLLVAVLAIPEEVEKARLLQWDKRAQKYFVTEVIF